MRRRIFLRTMIFMLTMLVVIPSFDQPKVLAQSIAYQEDFEDVQAQGWELEPGWQITSEGNNHILAGEDHVWARSNQSFDGDYHLSFRLKLLQGTIHLVYRLNDVGRYFIGFNAGGSSLNKQIWPDEFHHDLTRKDTPHSLNTWHQLEIIGQGDSLKLFVDGNQEWTYTDAQPLLGGSFAFETLDDSQAYVDDIVIYWDSVQPSLPAAATAAAPPSTPSNLIWLRTGGPLGGLGYDVRMRPDDLDRLYVTDAFAGVHISEDSGLTWFPSNEGITTRVGESGDGIPVFSLTIDPNNYDIVWIGTQYQRGIFKSSDGGRSWAKMDKGVTEDNGITFRGFAVEPGNSDVVYVAGEVSSWAWAGKERQGREFDMTRGVVYRTTNGGQTWTSVWRGENMARYIWIDPRNTNVIYISTGIFDREAANSDPESGVPGGEGVIKSTDGGKTWENVNNGLGNLYVGSLFMHPENPDILLAGTGNNQYFEGAGVYLTTDGAQTWIQTQFDEIITSVEFSSSDPQIAYAGSARSIYQSQDGGHTWLRVTGGQEENGWGAPGVRAGFPIDFQVDPRDSSRLFANEYGGGNFLSLDGGRTWEVASTGYTGAQVRALAVDPSQPGRIIAAARSGLFISYDGGREWLGISNPPAQVMEWNAVAIDPGDLEHLLASNNWMREIIYSHDGGETWRHTGTNLEGNRAGWRVITFAPSDPAIVYAGSAGYYSAGAFGTERPGQGIYVSRDGGKSWEPANTDLTDDAHVAGLAVDHSNPQRLFAAVPRKGILTSVDGGQFWKQVNSGLRSLDALSVAIHPENSEILLAGFLRAGIYRSSDGGQTWKASSSGMLPESSVTSIVFDPTNSQVVYAADLHSGVYRSGNGGTTWQPIVDGLRMRSVNALALTSDGLHLYAGTEGEGVFRLDLNGQPPASAPRPQPELATPLSVEPTRVFEQTPTETPVAPAGSPCGNALLPLAIFMSLVWLHRKRSLR